jgi:hypothetical protein
MALAVVDPRTLALEELVARYPHALVDFVLMAEADVALCPGAPLVPVTVAYDDDVIELRTFPEHLAAYTGALASAGAAVTVGG